VLAVPDLAYTVHEAGIRHGSTPEYVEAMLGRRPASKGAKKLRRILHGGDQPAGRRAVRRLPLGRRLTVELDGHRYHSSRHSWERDREREAYARGDDFRRYAYGDVFEQPAAMMAELGAALSSVTQEGSC
jgi:hypothetical protein